MDKGIKYLNVYSNEQNSLFKRTIDIVSHLIPRGRILTKHI